MKRLVISSFGVDFEFYQRYINIRAVRNMNIRKLEVGIFYFVFKQVI